MRLAHKTQLGAATAALAFSGMFLAPAAMAATPVQAAAVVVPAQYANPGAGSLTVSGSGVVQGDSFTVTVNGVANRVYSATVFSTPMDLGTTTAGADGSASFTFDTSGLDAGGHRVEVTDTMTGGVSTAYFTVTAASIGGNQPGGGTNQAGLTSNQAGGSGNQAGSGGLAFTGAGAVVPIGVLGVILVGGGAAAVVAGRSRKTQTEA